MVKVNRVPFSVDRLLGDNRFMLAGSQIIKGVARGVALKVGENEGCRLSGRPRIAAHFIQ